MFDVVFESFCTGFNTQPPEGGWFGLSSFRSLRRVSTHSRPKAAGSAHAILSRIFYSFNTQPPEGGWEFRQPVADDFTGFNTQPPEGGWKWLVI